MTAYRHGERAPGPIAPDRDLAGPSFTSADERLLARVAAHFSALGFALERDTDTTCDSLWITPPRSINPSWIIVRQHDGRYQLQDGLLTIERQGLALADVLLPEWLSSSGS